MDRDNGGAYLYRWELSRRPFYLLRCTTDGSDGWLELYDGDGTPLGYARTDWDCPVWKPKGLVRPSALTGDDPPDLKRELVQAALRLRGSDPSLRVRESPASAPH
jgi:hypothetical protein